MTEFLDIFAFDGLISICERKVSNARFFSPSELEGYKPPDSDVYFGPAARKKHGNEKSDTLGTAVLWVDVDNTERPQPTLAPTAVVFSGHGWHLYWKLREPLKDSGQIEHLNKLLIEDIPTADKACWNVNRLLRVPGTVNTKDKDNPVAVELKSFNPTIDYKPEDFEVLAKLDKKVRHKIRTGDSRGYPSKSERDWAILRALVSAGASDELIFTIFAHQPCGDKARTEVKYLEHSVEKMRAKGTPAAKSANAEISAKEDGFYVSTKNATRRVSTFTLDPTVLLDGSAFGSTDAVVCDVNANNYTWKDITFSRNAFTSVTKFDREAPVAAWQFLGSDRDVRLVLPYLLDVLGENGLPRVAATEMLGLHKIKDQWLFLGDNQTLGPASIWEGYSAPICWLPTQKEHPSINLSTECTQEELDFLAEMVPKLNDAETIWPMIGWYSATCLKPWLEEHKYRFPIMNVTGTKGSGKTTLIQRVFMKLFGQTDPKTYDSGTTRFVTLALMGSTNAIPLAFSEFRYELVERFIRFILLSYDTGHDPRGRGDQTTVDYPLSAPFTVDGEDLIADPAAQERMVVAQLHPETVEEGSEAYATFKNLQYNLPENFGGYFIQRVLQKEENLKELLEECRNDVLTAFPKKMPDRVRNNHIVTYFGIRLWCSVTGSEIPPADVLKRSITSVFDIEAGRARTFADTMVEDVVNAIAGGTVLFNYYYDETNNIVWFQLAPAHTWWITSRRRSGRGSLERDAIRMQLKEAPYMLDGQVVRDAWMYGIDIQKAYDNGLDIPLKLSGATFTMRI